MTESSAPKGGTAGPRDTPFVGRENESQRIIGALDSVEGGVGRLILVSGEAGLGKSRLVRETASLARDRGWRAVTGVAYEAGGAISFGLAVDLLRTLLHAAVTSDEREMAQEAIDTLTETAEDPGLSRWGQIDAVLDALRTAVDQAPPLRLVVLEDLHNADASTLELWTQVLRQLDAIPLLVMATFREPRQDATALLAFTDAARQSFGSDRIELATIPDDAASALVRTVTSDVVDEATIATIVRRGDGNPLFLEEAARDAARAARSGNATRVVPAAIRELVQRRIASLPEGTREVAAGLAVIGEPGDPALVAATLDAPIGDVASALDNLLDEGILDHDGEGEVQFKHALTREAIYEWVAHSRRRELHAAAAQAIEAAQGEQGASTVAYHLLRVGGVDQKRRAGTLLAQAGESSLASLAHEQAAERLETALQLMEETGEARSTIRRTRLRHAEARRLARADDAVLALFEQVADEAASDGDPETEAIAAIGYEHAYLETGRPRSGADGRSIPLLERALAHLEAAASLDTSSAQVLIARVLASNAQARNFAGDRIIAMSTAQRAVDIARASGDSGATALALDTYRAAITGPDALGEVLRLTREVVEESAAAGEIDLELSGLFWEVWALMESGRRRDAEAAIGRFGTLAERLRQPLRLSELHRMRGMIAQLDSDLAGARAEAERAYQLAAGAGNDEARIYYVAQMAVASRDTERRTAIRDAAADFAPRTTSIEMQIFSAYLLVKQGERDAAARVMAGIVDGGFDQLGHDHMWLAMVTLFSEAAAEIGDPRWAQLGFELLLPYADRFVVNSNAVCYGSVERILGRLAAVIGGSDAAERQRRGEDRNRTFGADVWIDSTATAITPVTKTFMFTDIVRSTNLAEAMGDAAWNGLLQWHNQTLGDLFRAFGGEEVVSTGDGFFVAFDTAEAAIDCAVAIQRGLAEHRATSGFAPDVRIGVHTANASEVDQNYHGLGVHEAARIAALAGGGEILASVSTAAGRATAGQPRMVELKGLVTPIEIVDLAWK